MQIVLKYLRQFFFFFAFSWKKEHKALNQQWWQLELQTEVGKYTEAFQTYLNVFINIAKFHADLSSYFTSSTFSTLLLLFF